MSDVEMDLDSAVPAVIKESIRITPETTAEVRQITLEVDDPAFRIRGGQNIALVVPGERAFGKAEHIRRYSVVQVLAADGDAIGFSILVRRCFYLDEVSGEQYPGIASNFLCDAKPGQTVQVLGPYRAPFKVPADPAANLLMIGTGTGIAPFRGFVQSIYRDGVQWQGAVRLFYGARNGMELLYMNEQNNDLANYYDQETFQAFTALAGRPLSDDREALEKSITEHVDEAWTLLQQPNTYVYLSGLQKTGEATDKVFAAKAGDSAAWQLLKQQLKDEGRWSELLYS